ITGNLNSFVRGLPPFSDPHRGASKYYLQEIGFIHIIVFLCQSSLMERKCPEAALQNLFRELGFVSGSDQLLPLLQRAHRAAEISDVTVLIEGETGTGKQILAQAIHRL